MSHWYRVTELAITPCHTVPRKTKLGHRPVNITDARELQLVPSVTTVLERALNKPNLVGWKVRQAILSALTLPRIKGETEDDYADRVVLDMGQESEKAKEFGQDVHQACENILTNPAYQLPPDLEPFVAGVREWCAKNVEEVYCTELLVANRTMGFAGRLDLHAKVKVFGDCLIDFKTQRVRKTPCYYLEWAMQLAAYDSCLSNRNNLVSVVIDTSQPGPVCATVWDEPSVAWEMFQHALALWKYLTGYDPSQMAT